MSTHFESDGREPAPLTRNEALTGWPGVPPLPKHHVNRPRLLAALDQAGGRPLILVSAPAGSGKTSLVAGWVAAGGATDRTAWVTFEERDAAFWPGAVRSLETLDVPVAAESFSSRPGALDRRLLTTLAAAVAGCADRLTLVVDGYELVSAEVADDLDFLLRHSGHQLQLVMVTRADPVLPLYRYRLEDTLAEIRMADLAFTDTEAEMLLKAEGVALAKESVHELNTRTKGWVTGLRFAAKILVERDDPDSAVSEVSGDTGNIGEYLMGEVLAAQTPEVRKLLLNTSIPDTIQPGLAEELAGRSAARTLAFLTRVNVFIEPVPQHPGFYRYHPFFRDLLRAELAYESPQQMVRLQRKAARWFAREGLLATSVSHFAAIDAWAEAAGEVVDDLAVGQLLVGNGASALGRSLRAMPESVTDPAASVVRATLALAAGDTELFGEELQRTLAGSEIASSSHQASVSLAVAVLQAVRARFSDDPRNAIALAETAERALGQRENRSRTGTHPELAALVLASKGIATLRRGELAKADEVFMAGTGAAMGPGCEPLLAECLGFMALIACFQGQLSRARALANRAVGIAESVSIPLADRQSAAQVALAWVDVEQYQLQSALEHMKAARKSDFLSGDPAARTLLALVKSGLQVARGDVAGAITTIDRAASDILDPSSWLVERLSIESAKLRLRNGESEVAVIDVEGLGKENEAEVALVVAQAQMQLGHESAAEDSLSRALVRGAPLRTLVTGWLVESARQLRRSSPARARVALERSLKLAEPECLRRPFLEPTPEVRQVLLHEAQHLAKTGWLHVPSTRGRPKVPAQRSTPAGARTGESPASPVVENLTDKELEVLGHLAELLTTEEIATAMFVSVNTIRTHVRSILRKLGVSRRNAAVRRARELQLLSV